MPGQNSTADTMAWAYQLTEISNVPGQEAGVQIIDRPPGGSANPHYHPDGHEWGYCASGSMWLTIGDAPARVQELARLGGFERLRSLGIPEDELGLVAAEIAQRPGARANPRSATPDEIEGLLRSIW